MHYPDNRRFDPSLFPYSKMLLIDKFRVNEYTFPMIYVNFFTRLTRLIHAENVGALVDNVYIYGQDTGRDVRYFTITYVKNYAHVTEITVDEVGDLEQFVVKTVFGQVWNYYK